MNLIKSEINENKETRTYDYPHKKGRMLLAEWFIGLLDSGMIHVDSVSLHKWHKQSNVEDMSVQFPFTMGHDYILQETKTRNSDCISAHIIFQGIPIIVSCDLWNLWVIVHSGMLNESQWALIEELIVV